MSQMGHDYTNSSVPSYQLHQPEVDPSNLATSDEIADLKKWIIASIVSNTVISFGIVGFLIFIYYTLLIEIENGK